jgi:pimeloyl-ACP methyl ester carboxylesterase
VLLENAPGKRVFFAIAISLLSCSQPMAAAERITLLHPDDPGKSVEAFLERPPGHGPWPAVVLLHGYQAAPSAGGRDFVNYGVLDKLAKRGYLAVAVSQPGFGDSSGPPDFCGPFTQHAVLGVIAKLTAEGEISKVVIEGVSRGAVVAGLIAARPDAIAVPLAGVVLISGLYDFEQFAANAKSSDAKDIVKSVIEETGGGSEALKSRSLLDIVRSVKTPMLIMNGAEDDRTDSGQARVLANRLVSQGVAARAIIYPGYGHQIPVEVRDKEIDPFIAASLGK